MRLFKNESCDSHCVAQSQKTRYSSRNFPHLFFHRNDYKYIDVAAGSLFREMGDKNKRVNK